MTENHITTLNCHYIDFLGQTTSWFEYHVLNNHSTKYFSIQNNEHNLAFFIR